MGSVVGICIIRGDLFHYTSTKHMVHNTLVLLVISKLRQNSLNTLSVVRWMHGLDSGILHVSNLRQHHF